MRSSLEDLSGEVVSLDVRMSLGNLLDVVEFTIKLQIS